MQGMQTKGMQTIRSTKTLRELSADEVDAVSGAWTFQNGDFSMGVGGWGGIVQYSGFGITYGVGYTSSGTVYLIY